LLGGDCVVRAPRWPLVGNIGLLLDLKNFHHAILQLVQRYGPLVEVQVRPWGGRRPCVTAATCHFASLAFPPLEPLLSVPHPLPGPAFYQAHLVRRRPGTRARVPSTTPEKLLPRQVRLVAWGALSLPRFHAPLSRPPLMSNFHPHSFHLSIEVIVNVIQHSEQSMFLAEGEKWARQRRLVAPFFSRKVHPHPHPHPHPPPHPYNRLVVDTGPLHPSMVLPTPRPPPTLARIWPS